MAVFFCCHDEAIWWEIIMTTFIFTLANKSQIRFNRRHEPH